ncbi:MAG: FAD:protein FMN transferase [Planctomycetaceae bacterium]|nr:FAD:protein FMN transferase [Planctomycetaceae bacterium]
MIHEFRDEIMKAVFTFRFDAPESEAMRLSAVAEEMFYEVRRLETLLSRFIEDSDAARINRLSCGESAVVAAETFRCLELAEEGTRLTNGYFDAAYLSPAVDAALRPFTLLTKPHRVRCEVESLHVDLGGIGKGFALDCIAPIPLLYGYSRALLCADSSTMLALEPPENKQGWEVFLKLDDGAQRLELCNTAVSCSGTSVKGEHIFDVKRREWSTKTNRCYSFADTAAEAEISSTAGLLTH